MVSIGLLLSGITRKVQKLMLLLGGHYFQTLRYYNYNDKPCHLNIRESPSPQAG